MTFFIFLIPPIQRGFTLMKIKSAVAVLFSGMFLFFLSPLVSAQQNISPELLSQYQSNPSVLASSERMQQLIKEYQKHEGTQAPPPSGQGTKSEEPSFKASESSLSPINSIGSVYENILRNINVHPDSMLSQLSVFGFDVFSQAKPSTFAPSDFASVPAEYPIHAGDEIIVMLWGRINEEYPLRVLRTGTINIPRIGPVSVAGLPFETVQKNILDRVGSIEGVHASVTMGQLRSIGIFIVGEVASPGFYTISSLSNITNALFAAGGPTRRGSLRNIQLKRNGQLVTSIDYYDFLLSGSDRSSLRLQSGDVIYVPIVQSMAAIAGNVRRCGLYELKGKTQLSDLIKLAGGLTPSAWSNRIQVERFINRQFQGVLDIESSNDDIPQFEILDGDIVKIFPILLKDKNAVYLSGNVLRPGKYEFRKGMRINDIIHGYPELLPETYFNYAIILRQNPETFSYQIFPFNLRLVLDTPSLVSSNILLEPKDEVVIYNKDFFEPDRNVSVEGAVTKPGTFKLLENMKIRDLILQAGGLRLEASRKRGELYRRNVEGKQAETQKIEFCIECAMRDDSSNNLLLMRSDRVYIRQKQGWEDERKVTLNGRFVYPGTYVILEEETLGALLKRSGGFKDDAYLSASVFTRKSVKELELKRKNEYLQQLDINMLNLSSELALNDKNQEAKELRSQLSGLRAKLSEIAPSGRVIIDLSKPEQYDSFALEDGDQIYIPRNMNTISVIGDVYNPSTFTFNDGKLSPWYYIESSGGLRETADKKHIYVVKANGLVITKNMQRISSIALAPGDAIVVPQRVRLTSAGKIFQETVDAIFKIATVAAVVITLINSYSSAQNTSTAP
jgi:protein involved in polysaccharide export with SLBB domain